MRAAKASACAAIPPPADLDRGHLDLVLGDLGKSLALKISFMIGLRRCPPGHLRFVGTRLVFLSGFGAISVVKMDLPVSRRSKGRGTTAVVLEEANAVAFEASLQARSHVGDHPYTRWITGHASSIVVMGNTSISIHGEYRRVSSLDRSVSSCDTSSIMNQPMPSRRS